METVDLRVPQLDIRVMQHELTWAYAMRDGDGHVVNLTGATLVGWVITPGSSTAAASFTFTRTDDANGLGSMSIDVPPGTYFAFVELTLPSSEPITLLRGRLVVSGKPGHP